MRRPHVLVSIAVALLSAPSSVFAVSGVLSGAYGAPRAIQTSQSNVQGPVLGSDGVNFSALAQLDRAYGFIADGTLSRCDPRLARDVGEDQGGLPVSPVGAGPGRLEPHLHLGGRIVV